MKKATVKKIGKILLDILMFVFLAICVFAVFLTIFSKRSPDGAADVFGYQLRIVTSDSMAKCELTDVSEYDIKDIPIRSMVFVQTVPTDPSAANEWYANLQVGDVLTFRYVYTTQVTITHRIVSISEKKAGGFIIELEGDNKNSESKQLHQTIDTSQTNSTNYVIGKVTGQAYLLGVVMSFLMEPIGIILAIIVPCFIIILLEIFKIVKVLSADKKKREEEITAQKDTELEELRRRLMELEQRQAASPPPESSNDTTQSNAIASTETQTPTNEEETQK